MDNYSFIHSQNLVQNSGSGKNTSALNFVVSHGKTPEYVEDKKDDRPFQCDTCGNRFRQQCHLQQHIRIHTNNRPYQCSYCEKKFKQKSQLDQHERIHTGEKPYQCPLCEKAFPQAGQLYSHKKTHGIDPKSNRTPRTQTRKRKSQETSEKKPKVISPPPVVYLMESYHPAAKDVLVTLKPQYKNENT
ncbi:zinc finger protein 22-like [Hydractinia symbiolongicarpus]|uniref:zinc finger protein 22-like n=1 Tax=Hydractinia symbiolongicarpus TaxID=13093 RepID=UPI00254E3CFF|nr:zinc finger protein 22-like [Hydractinia symbiolongicarpus]